MAHELPPPPAGMVWLTVAVQVPIPREGGWAALTPQERWGITAQAREAIEEAYGAPRPHGVGALTEP